MLVLSNENVVTIPSSEGVYRLYDDKKNILSIKGTMDVRAALEDVFNFNENANFFDFELDPMFTKRERELIQQYLQQHGELPSGGDDDLDDLF